MASFHCSVNVGGKGKAASHSDYIAREGKYSGESSRYEDLEASGHGNMPKWAEHNPAHFWAAADEHERVNGATYREIEVALPRELTPEQRRELVQEFIKQELGDKHANQWAIHCPKAALEGGEQPHAHIMYSERTRDSIERDPEQYFKRYNGKSPERGGCRKDSAGTEERLQATREAWATIQNAHLAQHGHAARVDHRSLEAQGIEREPEKHLGGRGVRQLNTVDVSALLERRAAEGELERAQRQVSVSVIDLSGDLTAAKAERGRVQRAASDAERWQGMTIKELRAEANALQLPSISVLKGWDEKICEVRDLQKQATEQMGQASRDIWQTRDELKDWREAHPMRAKLHDSGVFTASEIAGMETKIAQAKLAQEAASQKVEAAKKAEAREMPSAEHRAWEKYGPQIERLNALNKTIGQRDLAERKERTQDNQTDKKPKKSRDNGGLEM